MAVPLRVLILEDNPADIELLLHELRRGDFAPNWQQVETEEDYLAHLRSAAWDVILADFSLPQFDALQALAHLQRSGLDIPFIIVSGSISEEVAVECMKLGATDYLIKDRLARLGQAVATALEKKRVRDEKRQAEAALRKANRAYKTLSECNQALVRATDEAQLLNDICRIIVETGGYKMAWVGFAQHDEGKTVRPAGKAGYEAGYIESARVTWADAERGRGPAGTAIRTGQPQVIHNTQADPRFEPWRAEAVRRGYASCLALPLKDGAHTFGVLTVYSGAVNDFSDEETTLLVELADDLAYGITALRTRAERLQTQQALYVSQENLRVVVDNTPIILFALDREGIFTLSEGKGLETLGLKPGQVVGQSAYDLFDDIPELRSYVERTLKGETVHTTVSSRNLVFDVYYSPLRDGAGEVSGVIGVAMDMTERIRAEEKFRAVFEKSLDVIVILDGQSGEILRVNPTVQGILGYTDAALLGQPFSALCPQENPLALIEEVRAQGAIFKSQEFRRADGSTCPMDVTATLIPWDSGQAVLATLRDVSERKAMEQELLKAAQMRMEVEKQREIVEMKESFISMVSHQFRTPLTVILSSNELLENYYERLTPDKRLKYIQQVRQQTQYMTELLDDILIISRARAGKLEFQPGPLDLAQFCRTLVEQLELADNGAHRLTFTTDGVFEGTHMDVKLLQHIVLNLLSNALKYTPEGKEVRFQLRREGDDAVFRISDQGIGIPAKDQERLFEPFHRARNARQFQGTGLGLAIVKDCVVAHGGNIEFVSEENVGTTFTVRLPIFNAPDF